ncbi:MAG: hypothetical protein JO235_19605 [Chroococcidiopsidaceae cyanobacterium CP_BM_RX_35]|nr:hypothetical protein [Chroococcidiopsidaceae cyanobacterium CP_BM_RX_35]
MQIYSRRSPLSATVPTISNYIVVLAAIVADALGRSGSAPGAGAQPLQLCGAGLAQFAK